MEPVSLFVTCVADLLEPEVAVDTVRVLRAVGCSVEVPDGQTCCGQPAWNAGHAPEAAAVARTSLLALARTEGPIVVPAGSCAAMIRSHWPALFRAVGDDKAARVAARVGARVFELTEFLADHPLPPGSVPPCSVARHRSCHALRDLHIDEQPAALVASVEGVTVADWPDDDRCCGFGGTFAVKLPETSAAMADEKLDSLPPEVTTIVGIDSSCLLQLRSRAEKRGLPVRTEHVASLLARSLDDR